MSRSRILFFFLSAVVVFPLLAATLLRAAATGQSQPEEDSFYKYLAVFSETLGLVRQAYVDEPDMDTLMAGALDGTTDALDPFSLYVPASEVSGYLQAEAGIHQLLIQAYRHFFLDRISHRTTSSQYDL